MANVEIKSVSFSELDLPVTVYKYRIWEKPLHQTILTDRIVYFAPPSSFEDPIDCKIPLRWDLLTGKEIYDKYYHNAVEEHPNWSRQQRRKFARDWAKRSPVRNKELVAKWETEYAEKFDQRFGVLSLTANSTNEKMWTKYSDNGKGFCVGFNPNVMFQFFGGGGKVEYHEVLPDIHPMPKHSFEEQNYLQVFSKEIKWAFEEEYRVYKFNRDVFSIQQRAIQLPVEAFTEIILGPEISRESKKHITNIASQNFPSIEIIQS